MFLQTYNTNVLPLDLISVSPGEGFTYLPLPELEGIHTGGLWRSPDGEQVWKPLDARPYPNSDCRVPTLEADCLSQMKGQPGFIENWSIQQANGRWWIVRPYCKVVGQTFPVEHVTQVMIDQVEIAVRMLNAHHWEALQCDDLTVAIDPQTQLPFLLDLSNAHPKTPQGNWKADDSNSLYKWMRSIEWGRIAELRQHGQSLLHSKEWLNLTRFNEQYELHKHVYRLEQIITVSIEGMFVSYKDQTWWVLPFCLTPEQCDQYRTEWAWSPVPYQPQPQWLALDNLLNEVESWYRYQSETDSYNSTHQQADIQLVSQLYEDATKKRYAIVPNDLDGLHAPFKLEHQEHSDALMWKGKPTGWLIMDKIS
jgi:hypothetical protein